MPEAVVFDVDGTSLDSVDLHAKPESDAFGAYGRKLPFDDIRGEIGKGGFKKAGCTAIYQAPADLLAQYDHLSLAKEPVP